MKKFFCFLMAVLISISLCVSPATAAEIPAEDVTITVQVFDSLDDYQEYVSEAEDVSPCSDDVETTVLSAALVRKNGEEDETCQVYVNWTGDGIISRIRYKKITIAGTSALFPKTYGTFGTGSAYKTHYVTAAAIGSVKIGEVEIPTSVDKIKLTSKSFQAYYLSTASWVSAIEWSTKVEIS